VSRYFPLPFRIWNVYPLLFVCTGRPLGIETCERVVGRHDVRVWDPARPPGVYSSVKSLQRRRVASRNRNNTEQLCSGLL
jgi:hypothetical protein